MNKKVWSVFLIVCALMMCMSSAFADTVGTYYAFTGYPYSLIFENNIRVASTGNEDDAKTALQKWLDGLATIIVDKDLNDEAEGKYIYLGYKTTKCTGTTNLPYAITGIRQLHAAKSENLETPPDTYTEDGITWKLLDSVDLNDDAGGDYIYLYYTTDPLAGPPINGINWSSTNNTNSLGTDEFPVLSFGNKGWLSVNRNAGGDDIYLCVTASMRAVDLDYLKSLLETANGLLSSNRLTDDLLETAYEKGNEILWLWNDRTLSYPTSYGDYANCEEVEHWITMLEKYIAGAAIDVDFNASHNGGRIAGSTANINSERLTIGSNPSVTYTIPALDVSKTDYTFLGWSKDKDAHAAQSDLVAGRQVTIYDPTVFYAIFKKDAQCLFGFRSADGKWDSRTVTGAFYNNDTSATYDVPSVPTTVVVDGKTQTFVGWHTENKGLEPLFSADAATVTGAENQVFVAIYTMPLTLSFDTGKGSAISSATKNEYVAAGGQDGGATFTLSESPTPPEGYSFDGWATSEGGDVAYETGDTVTITEDRILYAVWEPNNYRIDYQVNNGAINSGIVTEYTYGVGATLPTDVTRVGYTFAGWYEASDFSDTAVTQISTTDIGNKTFYAKWLSADVGIIAVSINSTVGTIDETTNTVALVLPAGSSLPTGSSEVAVTAAMGATVSNLKTEDGGATWTFTVTAEDEKSTADYTINVSVEASTTYTIRYNANGGTGSVPTDSSSYAALDSVTVLFNPAPNREGYNFLGWSEDSSATAASYTDTGTKSFNITEDTTLYAVWEKEAVVTYPIYVGDIQVTSANMNDVLGAADEGATVSYNPESCTLTLDNASIETDRYSGINVYASDHIQNELEILLKGNNTIRTKDTSGVGINTQENVCIKAGTDGASLLICAGSAGVSGAVDTMTLDGLKLTFEPTGSSMHAACQTFSAAITVRNCAVEIKAGSKNGFIGYGDILIENSTVTAKHLTGTAIVSNHGSLSITQGSVVDVTSTANTDSNYDDYLISAGKDVLIDESAVTADNGGTKRGLSAGGNITISCSGKKVSVSSGGIAVAAPDGKISITGGNVQLSSTENNAVRVGNGIEVSGNSTVTMTAGEQKRAIRLDNSSVLTVGSGLKAIASYYRAGTPLMDYSAASNNSYMYVKVLTAEDVCNVTVSANPAEAGSVTGNGSYAKNTQVTVTATPNSGYRFVKWMENGSDISTDASYTFQVNADRTLVAVFEANSYSVTLPTGNGYTVAPTAVSTSPVAHGGSYSFTVTIAAGYDGSAMVVKANGNELQAVEGVYTISGITADQVVTVEGVASVPSTFIVSGTVSPGIEGIKILMYPSGSYSPTWSATTDTNGYFSFSDVPDGTYTVEVNGSYTVDGTTYANAAGNKVTVNGADATIDPKVKATHFTVTFDANGHGTAPESQVVLKSNTVTKPADPTSDDGWVFAGWYTDKDCTNAYDFNAQVTSTFTLYAKWTNEPLVSYSATLNVTGLAGATATLDKTAGIGPNDFVTVTITPVSGKAFYIAPVVTADGATAGTPVADANGVYTCQVTGFTGDAIITVSGAVDTYTITYELNGGAFDGDYPTTYTKGVGVTLPTNVIKQGYTFFKWYTDSALTTYPTGSIGASATGHKVFYAKWNPITYSITLPSGDGYTVAPTAGSASPVVHGGSYSFTVTVADGYDGSTMIVKANGSALTAMEGVYTISDITADQSITVEGIVKKSSDAGVTAVSVGGVAGTIDAENNTISVELPAGSTIPTDGNAVSITPATGATVSNLQTGDNGATWTFTVIAEDGITQQNYTVYVSVAATAPNITATALADGTVGTAYSQTMTATGDASITWIIKAGTALPNGLTLDGATGVISGTPTAAGTFTFTVVATNAGGTDEQALSITIKAAQYTITFNFNDGTAQTTTAQTGTDGKLASLPVLTRTGYIFGGWYATVDGQTKITTDTVFTANATVYAKWTLCDHAGNTNQPDCTNAAACSLCGATISALGHGFTNGPWINTDPNGHYRKCARCIETDITNIAAHEYDDEQDENCNVCGYVRQVTARYTVTWVNADGAVLEIDENVAYGATPSYDGEKPTKAADAQYTYTFAGWSPEVTAVTGNATYMATFSTTLNTYTVTWVNEDGTELETDENVPYGTEPSYDGATPAKPGDSQYSYVFVGWQPEVVPVTGNATYTATFADSTNTYTVTWLNADGKVLEVDENVPYGKTPSYNGTTPTKPSDGQYTYAFAGWTPEVTMVVGDATYTATFVIDTTVLAIITQPQDQYVVEGQTATFTIEARGDGLTYQWYINRNKGAGWRLIDGATNPIHTTKTTDLDCDGFKYGCVVKDMYGNTLQSDVAILHVSAVPVLPETGDNSHPMLYLTLLLTSLAGMIVLKKKRVKA